MTGRMLVCYSNSSNYVPTTAEYLAAFSRHSQWDVRYLHVTHGAELGVDLGEFDAVLQNYCARLPIEGNVSENFAAAMRDYRGIKIIAIQDEYDNTNILRARLVSIGYDIILTCIPEDQIARVYPPEMFKRTRFVPVLTGYVPRGHESRPPAKPIAERPITIGYRGRDIGPRFGKLAFDKLEIGRRMKAECERLKIIHDIEWTEDKRIYGPAWYEFLGNCKAVLGTESGSNVFDWDGEVTAEYRSRGGPSYEDFLPWLAEREAEWNIGQISPRIFEAAACRTPMVLFEGRYSGIIEPGEHYIPLRKDFSNLPDVLDWLNKPKALQALADRAWHHLIQSGRYTYRAFHDQVASEIAEVVERKGVTMRPAFPPGQWDLPSNDPMSLASMSEVPTRYPRPPVYFYYKHAKAQVDRLLPELSRQAALSQLLGDRLREETQAHSEEITALRSAAARAA